MYENYLLVLADLPYIIILGTRSVYFLAKYFHQQTVLRQAVKVERQRSYCNENWGGFS